MQQGASPPENKPCPQCRGLWCGPISCKYTGTQHAKVGRHTNPLLILNEDRRREILEQIEKFEPSDGLSPDERENKRDDDRSRAKDYK